MRIVTIISFIVGVSLSSSAQLLFAAEISSRLLAGVWSAKSGETQLRPMDKSAIPFTKAGRARYQKNLANLKSGALIDEAKHLCLPEGMPRAMTSAYPFQILVTANQIVFMHEANRAFRLLRFADSHADTKIWDPAYMGEPIAKWSGNTLVIDSTNFKAERIYLDGTGVPVSDKLHLSERVTLSANGQQLTDLITINDPEIFTKPWTVRLTFDRRDDLVLNTEWVCGEPHRALPISASASSTIAKPAPLLASGASVVSGASALSAAQQAMSGYWVDSNPAPYGPPGRGAVPGAGPMGAIVPNLQPWAAEVLAKTKAIEAVGDFVSTPNNRCIPSAVAGTGLTGGAYGIDVLVEPRQVTFLYELDRNIRVATIDQQHPATLTPNWLGHSVGHWEADTLVVDTVGFNGKNLFAVGIPMSPAMHVVQRLRLVNEQIEEVAHFEDAGSLTKPFDITRHYVRGVPYQEYICAENNKEGGVPTASGIPTPYNLPDAQTKAAPKPPSTQ